MMPTPHTPLSEEKTETSASVDSYFSKLSEKDLHFGRRVVFILATFGYWVIFKLKYKMKVYGRENIPFGKGSYIVVSNHSSLLDPPAVSVALKYLPIAFMAKKELFYSWKKYGYNWMGTFAVDRQKVDISTIRTAKAVLNTGFWCLGMFPEGTRSLDGEVADFKKGVGFFAKLCKTPILPVGIARQGKDEKGIIVHIGEPIPYNDDVDTLTQTVHNAIVRLKALGDTHPTFVE